MASQVSITGLPGIPMVQAGDDLAALTIAAIERAGLAPADNDVLVVAQKVVSKSEGRIVDVATVTPSVEAVALAAKIDKDPRLVEVVLSESRRVVRHRPNLLIVEHRLGYVMANAGIDHSNVAARCCCRSTPTPPRSNCATASSRITARRSRSSSRTVSGGRGGAARWASRSAPRGCRR
jgi:coenzyme F420-0:L-glutamate ligase/coenzyme F420-1:gamma-L-glutamate ligase